MASTARTFAPRLAAAALLSLAILMSHGRGQAGGLDLTFTVNVTGDAADTFVGDFACDSDAGTSGDQCTLRAAVQESNANNPPDRNYIHFGIPGAGPHTITVSTDLPTIARQVTIDGFTQPGASPNTNALSAGSNAVMKIIVATPPFGPWYGLDLGAGAGGSIIRGLVVNSSGSLVTGIHVSGASGVTIEGNYIGTNAAGTGDIGNGTGIMLQSGGNTVGGPDPADRNVISGNATHGVQVYEGAGGNTVRGNYIGTSAAGTGDLGNGRGVDFVRSPGNTVTGNVISGNNGMGVSISSSTGTVVSDNYIGTAVDGSSPLGNGSHGIYMQVPSSGSRLEGNTAAHNGGDGAFIWSDVTGVEIVGGSYFSNGGLGIDLAPNGVTANDLDDPDTGANQRQNFPVLTSAESGGVLTIEGSLNTVPNSNVTVQFYSSPACDASGYGEGQTYRGSFEGQANSDGDLSFSQVDAAAPVGHYLTATAMDASGNTSEFSPCLQIEAAPATPTPSPTPATPTPTPTATPTPLPSGETPGPSGETPGPTPTPTATPVGQTPTPLPSGETPTPTPTPTPAPTPTGPADAVLGNADCDGDVDSVDGLMVLRDTAGLQHSAACIAMGDVDCDEDRDSVDALRILRHVAALSNPVPPGCRAIGT